MLYLHCRIVPGNVLDALAFQDIIVFGSNINEKFVVDTVFVIKDRISTRSKDDPLSKEYVEINGPCFDAATNRVYCGTSHWRLGSTRFSFFPAKLFAGGQPQPFARPMLEPTVALRGFLILKASAISVSPMLATLRKYGMR